jgi:hypothetical protein
LFFSDRAKNIVSVIRQITVSTVIAAKLTTGLNITTLSYSGVPAQVTIGSTANPQQFSILKLDGVGMFGLNIFEKKSNFFL